MTRLTSCADAEAAAGRAAREVARGLRDAARDRGIAHLALSGGSSPKRAYELLRDTDLAIKTGRIEPEVALDLVVADIVGLANLTDTRRLA